MLSGLKEKLNREKEIYLDIKVGPGKGKTEIMGVAENGMIKMKIKARPEKGEANAELTDFLAEFFKTKKENIRIMRGRGSRFKLLKVLK